jgi:hypothetical protein
MIEHLFVFVKKAVTSTVEAEDAAMGVIRPPRHGVHLSARVLRQPVSG